jgi:pimeloyl-ACP methyl ester carboxylesterase
VQASVRGIPVNYEEFGEGRTVVLLHGFGLDHRFTVHHYEPLFEDRPGWRRIHPDMPGMGRTPAPDWLVSEDQMLDVLLDFVEAVAPGEPLVVIGSSWGAYLARGLADRRADRLDGLMLVVPVVHADRDTRDLPPRSVLVTDPDVVADLAPGEETWLEVNVIQTAETLAAFRAAIKPGTDAADAGFLERMTPRYGYSFEDELTTPIPAPTLIVAGRQDSICGYRDAWQLLDHLPRASYVVLDRAGHALEDEQPTLFRALAGEWLDRVKEFAPRPA